MANYFRASKIKIDGVYAEDYGIYLQERPDIPTAELVVNPVPIRGRDGELTKIFGYRDVGMDIIFHMFDEEDGFKRSFRRAKPFILGARELVFDDDPTVFHKVKAVSISDSPTVVYKYGEIPATFTLAPFQYELQNDPLTITKRTVITNEGYKSQPIITAQVAGTGKVYIGEQEITIKDVNGSITIDTEMQNSYRDDGGPVTNLNSHMIGKFPVLDHGDNAVEFDGDIESLEIVCNKRWV